MKYFSRSHNRVQNLRPPDLYEYFVDNFWFNAAGLENQKINEPLRGSHNADVVIFEKNLVEILKHVCDIDVLPSHLKEKCK